MCTGKIANKEIAGWKGMYVFIFVTIAKLLPELLYHFSLPSSMYENIH